MFMYRLAKNFLPILGELQLLLLFFSSIQRKHEREQYAEIEIVYNDV